MIVIIISALLTVVLITWLIHPLMKNGNQKQASAVMLVLPLTALALYLWQGRPDLASASALFEQDGPRAVLRKLAGDELRLTQALSQKPGDHYLQTQLGEVFYARGLAILVETGDRESATGYFDSALSVAPEDAPYIEKLKADRRKMGIPGR